MPGDPRSLVGFDGPELILFERAVPPAFCRQVVEHYDPTPTPAGEREYVHPDTHPALANAMTTLTLMSNEHYRAKISELQCFVTRLTSLGLPSHFDNEYEAVNFNGHARPRCAFSAVLYLSDLADYDGGELTCDVDGWREPRRMPIGSAVVFRGDIVHEVAPVTRGERLFVKVIAVVPATFVTDEVYVDKSARPKVDFEKLAALAADFKAPPPWCAGQRTKRYER